MKRLLVFALSLFLCGFISTNLQAQDDATQKLEDLKEQLQFLKDKIKNNETQNADLLKQAEAIEGMLKEGWTFGGDGILAANFTSLADWYAASSAEETQVGINANVNLYADYKQDKWLWNNRAGLKLGYNRIRTSPEDESDFVKNIDEIRLESNADYLVNDTVGINIGGSFLSQFAKSFTDIVDASDVVIGEQIVSGFLSPAYVTLGVGIKYVPNNKFNVVYHPLSYQGTFIRSEIDGQLLPATSEDGLLLYGVDYLETGGNKTSRHILGSNLKVGYREKITSNINLASSLDYYFSYIGRDLTTLNDSDIIEDAGFFQDRSILNWNTVVTFTFNKYISATADYTLRYNLAETTQLQRRGFFGVGLTAQF